MPKTDTPLSLTITRTFAAPPQRVFDAWLDPEQRILWWGAAPDYTCDLCEIDPRVGGRFRCNMKSTADGKEHFQSGEFLEIDPPRRLVFTWSWEDPADAADHTTITIDLIPTDRGTQLTFTHHGFIGPNAAPDRDSHHEGWDACFDSLARLIDR